MKDLFLALTKNLKAIILQCIEQVIVMYKYFRSD